MAESTKEATAAGAKVTTVATGEHATADAPVEPETGFPLYAMRMRDFLELTRLEPHNTLAAKGLVVPVDFSGEHRGERLNFVSHQWLAYAEADPEGAHLKTMQAIFRMAIAGESIFRSEEDWNAYSKGYTAENAGSASTKHASATQGSFGDEESVLRSEAHFLASIADGWVWMAVWKSTSASDAPRHRAGVASMAWRLLQPYVRSAANLISTQVDWTYW